LVNDDEILWMRLQETNESIVLFTDPNTKVHNVRVIHTSWSAISTNTLSIQVILWAQYPSIISKSDALDYYFY